MRLLVVVVVAAVVVIVVEGLVQIPPFHLFCDTGGKIPRSGRINTSKHYCLDQAYLRGINGTGVRIGLFDIPVHHSFTRGKGQLKNTLVTHPETSCPKPRDTKLEYEQSTHASTMLSIMGAVREACPGVAPGAVFYSYEIICAPVTDHFNPTLLLSAAHYAVSVDKIDIAVFPNGFQPNADPLSDAVIRIFNVVIDKLTDAGIEVFAAAGQRAMTTSNIQILDAPAILAKVNSVGCLHRPDEVYAMDRRTYPVRPNSAFYHPSFTRETYGAVDDAALHTRALPDISIYCTGIVYAPAHFNRVCTVSDGGGSSEAVAVVAALHALVLSAKRKCASVSPAVLTWETDGLDGSLYPVFTHTGKELDKFVRYGAIQYAGGGALPVLPELDHHQRDSAYTRAQSFHQTAWPWLPFWEDVRVEHNEKYVNDYFHRFDTNICSDVDTYLNYISQNTHTHAHQQQNELSAVRGASEIVQ
jgi:hypothetical protein